MNEENSKLPCQETALSKEFDQTDFSGETNVQLTNVDSLTDQDAGRNVHIKSIMGNIRQEALSNQISPVLLKIEKKQCDVQVEEISINSSTIKNTVSLIDLHGKEFVQCQSSSDIDFPQHKSLQKSCSQNNINVGLSTLPATCLNADFTDELIESTNIKVLNDEEKTFFNNRIYVPEHIISVEENTNTEQHKSCNTEGDIKSSDTKLDKLDNKSVDSAVRIETPTNLMECKQEICINGEQGTSTTPIKNTWSNDNLTHRPTLVDDSRLVKISLPANPMNLMQTNTQFLNKSRNFLNFITEKSTNIMEKALLPQHLTVKYNSVLKSNVDNTGGEKKCINESYTSAESVLTGLPSNPAVDSSSKTKSIPTVPNSSITINSGRENGESETITQQQNELEDDSTSSKIAENAVYNMIDNLNIGNVDPNVNNDLECSSKKLEEENYDNAPKENIEIDNSQPNGLINMEIACPKQSLLEHPVYLTLLKDYTDLKATNIKLQGRIEYLEERNKTLEAEKSGEIFTVQIETLEKTVNRLTSELRTSLATQEMLKKEYNAANKERESMVMKYAVSEKQLIDTQRARDSVERKIKEITKEQDLLQSKVRQAQGERTRICNILDGKCREVSDLQKEVERLKEDVKMRDVKLKWTQNKLKTEMDLQKETQQKLDKAMTRINEMKEECDQVRKETQESMRKFQQSEENKAVTLDQQLKEQQARLILERHVTEDKEMLRLQLQKEVDVLKHRQQVLIEENNALSLKIQDAEKNSLHFETNLSSLKIIADQRQKEIVDLHSKVSELETLKLQLQHKDQCLASVQSELKHLQSTNEELQSDMCSCRQREAGMLDFTQKLTDKNVRLQSEFTALEAKVKQLEEEHGPLHERISELNNKIKVLEESLTREQKLRSEECEILATHLAEQTQLAQNLAQKLEDSEGENAVLKRKQQISMKEMTRELQQCRKRLEAFETASPCNSLDVASRTGSNVSLNTGDALNGALSDNSANSDQPIQSAEPTRQALIDRIIKLQKINVKRAEKLDFFEEHTRTLTEELQKKTRIIQNYILHENFGAMGSNERDRHKAELARHGGIMASVYSQRISDDNMTLELSLEINQKLQTVLEDALLKNITLKDNIDTLGEEIARLTMQNRQRQILS